MLVQRMTSTLVTNIGIRSGYLTNLVWGQTSNMYMVNLYMVARFSMEALRNLPSLICTTFHLYRHLPSLVERYMVNILACMYSQSCRVYKVGRPSNLQDT